MKQHKNPCAECPFRKKSMRGYLGPHDSFAEIRAGIDAGQKFPCHLQVNKFVKNVERDPAYDEDDPLALDPMREAVQNAPHCAGALQFMNNTCRLSRSREIADLQRKAGKSNEVFETDKQATDYHDSADMQSLRDKVKRKTR